MEEEGRPFVAVLITKFKVLPSLVITPVKPDENYSDESLLEIIPKLYIRVLREENSVICNCIDYSKADKVLFQPIKPPDDDPTEDVRRLFDDNDGDNIVEPDTTAEDVDADDLYCQTFAGRGSYWEEKYQRVLIECRRMLGNNEDVVVRLVFEPENRQDRNAIRFDAYVDGSWHPLGYAGLRKIPKLTKAIKMGEIRSISLARVKGQYVQQQNKMMMTGYFSIVKSSLWLKDYDGNTYNAVLQI